MATLKQVAEKAGVSRRTVDRVINNRGSVHPDTAQSIRQALKDLDYQPDQAGQALAAKKRKIRLMFCSIKGGSAVLHEEIRQGAMEKARELKKLGITVEFCTIDRDCPPGEEESERIVNEFCCDGLAVIPLEDKTINRLIRKAESKGIPIVFYNIDNRNQTRNCYVGCDYVRAGRMAAGLSGLWGGEGLKAAIVTVGDSEASLESPNYRNRVEGFEKELAECCPQAEIVGRCLLGRDVFDCYDSMKGFYQKHPDMNVVYLVNPGDYSVCRALKKVAGDRAIRLITNDLTEEAAVLLQEGIISATISQEPERQGSMPLQILFELLVFGKKPEQEKYYTDLHIYIPQSLA